MMYPSPSRTHSPASVASYLKAPILNESSGSLRMLVSFDQEAPEGLSFLKERDPRKLERALPALRVGCVLVHPHAEPFAPLTSATLILVEDPLQAFVACVPLFFDPEPKPEGIHPSAIIDPSAVIDPTAGIGPLCVVGPRCRIGAGAVLHSHVALYRDSVIGARAELHAHVVVREAVVVGEGCVLQPGAVIGADGFGYYMDRTRGLTSVPQLGGVTLHRNVDVGANSCIDRGTLGSTEIGASTKLDNLVQVGHNVRVGSHSVLCGQAGVAGSVTIGDQVTIGGQSGVADHMTIASGVRVGGKSAALTNIEVPGDYLGIPAIPAGDWRRRQARLRRLDRGVLPKPQRS